MMFISTIIYAFVAVLVTADSTITGECPGNATLPGLAQWSGWGANAYNNRWASRNTRVSSSSVNSLTQHCHLQYAGGVSATPTINGKTAYYPTWGGLFVALNYRTCVVKWQINVTDIILAYAPITGPQTVNHHVSRTSPQVTGGIVYFGTLTHALLVAVDKETGALLGTIQINPHPLALVTMSPTVYEGQIFVGAASNEEAAAEYVPGYVCCSFVGNMVALTFTRRAGFKISWNVRMLPDPPGNWSGGAIWGSQPSIDPVRSQVFIATGNVYTAPDEYLLCQNQSQNIAVVAQGLTTDPCIPPDVLQESVIAFDLATGLINWANQLTPLDAWTVACGIPVAGIPRNPAQCPYTPGPDADFGMAPTFVPASASTPHGKDTVVVGQKNGILYALSAQAGRPFWSTVTSPSGVSGGLIWGIAVDDSQVYFAAINYNQDTWQLQPSNQTITNSAMGSASLTDGTILWETQTPLNSTALAPPSVVNDVVFFGRTTGETATSNGGLLMVDKYTGAIIRDVGLDSSFHGGTTIQDQFVLFGSGYSTGSINGSLYVMSV